MKAETSTDLRAAYGLSEMLLRDFFTALYINRPRVQSPRTREFYRDEISKLDRHHGEPVALSGLSEALVLSSCRSQLLAGRSYATVQKHQTAIRALWAYAFRKSSQMSIAVASVPDFERWPVYDREPISYSGDELSRILQSALRQTGNYGATSAGVFWPAIILTAYETGCRISAIMAVKWSDYDPHRGILLFRAEAAKDRADTRCHLSSQLRGLLDAMPQEAETVFGCFPFDRAPKAYWRGLNRRLKAILADSQVETEPRVLWHKFRKTFATNVASVKGESVAQSMLGHSSLSVTRRYLDKSKLDLPRACDILPPVALPGLRIVG
jgi:integrase